MEFLKPQKYILPEEEFMAEMTIDIAELKQFGVKLALPMIIATLSKNHAKGQIAEINISNFERPEIQKHYYELKMLLLHCSWLGEILFGILKSVNDEHLRSADQNTVTQFLGGKSFEKLDFMGHKDLLCNILKLRSKSKTLPFDRKIFCKLFDDLINQRNAFTHGELIMLETDNGFQILLRSNLGLQILDKHVLNSFNEGYNEIRKTLSVADKFLTSL